MISDDVYEMLDPADGLKAGFPNAFRHCVKVNVQNVSDYYYANPQEKWYPSDFPNVAPPWRLFWMEWRTAAIFYSDNPSPWILKNCRTEKSPGLHSINTGLPVYKVWTKAERRAVMTFVEEPEFKPFGSRWVYRSRFFNAELPGAYLCEYLFFVSAEGELLEPEATDKNNRLLLKHYPEFSYAADAHKYYSMPLAARPTNEKCIFPHHFSLWTSELMRRGHDLDVSMYDVMWLALSFCNCRNVVVKNAPIDQKLRAARQRRGKLHVDGVRTISITPIKKLLTGAAGPGGSLQRELKIRRGHFKTFKEKGLFGKHFGTFHWSDWMREPKAGESVRYDVKTEKGGPDEK